MKRIAAVGGIVVLGLATPSGEGATDRDVPSVEKVAPGIVSTERNETFPAPSPDGRTLYFSRYADGFECQVLMRSRRTPRGWSEPDTVAFSGRWGDRAPRWSSDGTRLYFTSDRPLPGRDDGGPGCHEPGFRGSDERRDFNLWMVERADGGWTDPRPVPGVATEAWEAHATPTSGGALYFASTRTGSRLNDVWRAAPGGEDREVANVGPPISSELRETDVWVSGDESTLVFVVTDHPEGYGGDDLWISRRDDGAWSPPRNLGAPVNTEAYEYGPVVTPDGWLWFTSHRDGTADLYRVRVDEVTAWSRGRAAGAERFAPGVISTDADELTAAFAPDGTLAFVRREGDGPFTIHLARCDEATCSEPVAAPFSGDHHDQAPAFSPDGSRLWFQSRRPKGPDATPDPDAPRDDDVWVVERRGGAWGEPRLVGPPVSLEAPRDGEPFEGREMAPSVDAAGALYFWSNRPSDAHGASDLYRAEPDGSGGFLAPANLGAPVNGPHYETHPWIAPDGSLLLFSCDGCPDSMGGSDLYVSRRLEGGWSEPVNLGPAVNSTAYDFGASITADGRWLVFSSNRVGGGEEPGPQNIYRVEVERVPALGVD